MQIQNKVEVEALYSSESLTERKMIDYGTHCGHLGMWSLCEDEAGNWWVINRDSKSDVFEAFCHPDYLDDIADEMFTMRAELLRGENNINDPHLILKGFSFD